MTTTFKKSPELRIWLKNHKTHVQLLESKRVGPKGGVEGPNIKWTVDLVEMEEKQLILDVPKDFCTQSDRIQISISTLNVDPHVELEISAQVSEWNPHSEDPERACISLEFIQFDQARWEQICTLFDERQADIELLLSTLKE